MRSTSLLFLFLVSPLLPGCVIDSRNIVQIPFENSFNGNGVHGAPGPSGDASPPPRSASSPDAERDAVQSTLVALVLLASLALALALASSRWPEMYGRCSPGLPARRRGADAKRNLVAAHVESAPQGSAAYEFDLFVVYADADADFVHGYLLPALNLPSPRVLLVDEMTLGAPIVSEIDRGVSRSRFTVAVLSPAYLEDRWAVFGEQLASHLSVPAVHVVPLRLTHCKLPPRLEARVALDFTEGARWNAGVARLRALLHTPATPRTG